MNLPNKAWAQFVHSETFFPIPKNGGVKNAFFTPPYCIQIKIFLVNNMNYIEAQILKAISNAISCDVLDIFFKFISFLGDKGAIWIVFTLIMLIHPSTRKIGFCSAISLLLCLLVGNTFLKPFFNRIRPYDFDITIRTIIPKLSDPSFPSGHTMAAFAFAHSAGTHLKKARPYLYVAAILMGVSRIYLCMHYPSDVVFGAVFGICFGISSCKIYERLKKK